MNCSPMLGFFLPVLYTLTAQQLRAALPTFGHSSRSGSCTAVSSNVSLIPKFGMLRNPYGSDKAWLGNQVNGH